jgi:hypothetical protein
VLSESASSRPPAVIGPTPRLESAWPSAEQILLLHAALDEQAGAIPAWEQWRRAVDIENLDYGSHRLLPLLYRNLMKVGAPPHPWLGRMKGLHRHSWVRNHRLFARVAALIRELRDELGTPAMLLKGAALAMHAYPDPGLRPMDDCDLLVPAESLEGALALLKRRGWQAYGGGHNSRPTGEITPHRRRVAHSQDFLSSEPDPSWKPVSVDLHWRTLLNAGDDGELNTNLWGRAITVSLPDGTPALIPDSTDLLGQICLHGLQKNPVPPVRWAADAVMLLRDSAAGGAVTLPIDWPRLQRFAVERALTLRLSAALDFLADTLRAPVPQEIRRQLRSHPVSPEERAEFRVQVNGEDPIKLGFFADHLTYKLYRRRRPDEFGGSRLRDLRSAAGYLCGLWALRSPAELPWAVVRFGARRVWRLVSSKLAPGRRCDPPQ